jgi:transposase
MDSVKSVGMDVHRATIVIAVLDTSGKLLMESILETQAATILQFIQGLKGTLYATFEEGTYSAWLYDLLSPYVAQVVVCDPRKNALLKVGNKNDRIDARKLADLLRAGLLKAVYHGGHSLRGLKELARSYVVLTQDATRVMSRRKALYRGRGIRCAGRQVYLLCHREGWLEQLREPGVRRRAERLYQQLDLLQSLRQEARRDLVKASRKYGATSLLRTIPCLGPIRVALLAALVQTAHRFRTQRQFWAYIGLALETRISGEYRLVAGQRQRAGKALAMRGLSPNHHHALKNIFKAAAPAASVRSGPFRAFYESKLRQGMRPEMARLTLARKMAAITLTLGKKGVRFDPEELKPQAA